MLRFSAILLIVLTLSIAASGSEEDPFNVDFRCGWGSYFRPMEWTPLEIELGGTAELTEPFAGSVTISSQQDGLNTLNVTNKFVLTPDLRLRLPLVTKLAFTANKCDVTIRDEHGRKQWDQEYSLWDYSTRTGFLTSVAETDLLIGLVGRSKFGLLGLPKQSLCQSATGAGKVYVGHKLPYMVPWDWTGFVPLDLLVLYDPDWTLFKPQQLNAIVQWVSNGGRLFLVLGSHPLSAANPIARFLPFELQDVKQVAVQPGTLEKWDLTTDEPETVSAWPLAPKAEARFYEAETYDTNECLFATACAGFGRVSVLAFDPSTMSDRQTGRAALFWVSRIQEILKDTGYSPRGSVNRGGPPGRTSRGIVFASDPDRALGNRRPNQNRFDVGYAQGANNAVMEFLYQGIKPLSIWWVIFLLTTLAVLLGPLDYKLLKRKDRLPLTWLTCTFWIALFTVGAYYGVQALRGGDMELRVVSVLDGIEDSDHAWSTDYCGLFAPYSDDYRLKGLQDNQWWSGIAPTQQSVYQYNREAAGRRIFCFQHDGGNVPYSLPINIWTIQCLLNESPVRKLPFTADVRSQGEEIVVNIVNESESPILNAYVYLGNNYGVNLGPVPAGAGKQFRKRTRPMGIWASYDSGRYRNFSTGQRNYSGKFQNKDAYFAQGCMQRTRAISDYLARGAAVVCAEYDQAPLSFAVDARSCKENHVQLARLVVFPKEQKEEIIND